MFVRVRTHRLKGEHEMVSTSLGKLIQEYGQACVRTRLALMVCSKENATEETPASKAYQAALKEQIATYMACLEAITADHDQAIVLGRLEQIAIENRCRENMEAQRQAGLDMMKGA